MSRAPTIATLLPELYRRGDVQSGGALMALCDTLDRARDTVESDIDALYRDWFIETCQPDMIAWLATLVGCDGLPYGAYDPRALVADALAFGRRKGTHAATQHRLYQLTGWPARVVDGAGPGSVDIVVHRQPLDTVRGVRPMPYRADDVGDRASFWLHPLGIDCALYDGPPMRGSFPTRLSRDASPLTLAEAVTLRFDKEAGETYYARAKDMVAADLSDWNAGGAMAPIVIDPVLGRLVIRDGAWRAARLTAAFTYASAGRLGGGCYARTPGSVARDEWLAYVYDGAPPAAATGDAVPIFASVAEALAAFADQPSSGVIRILDSATYAIGDREWDRGAAGCIIGSNACSSLRIEASDGATPTLTGTLRAIGTRRATRLAIAGIWIAGHIDLSGDVDLAIDHCTVLPPRADQPAIVAHRGDRRPPAIDMAASIIGPVHAERGTTLSVSRSVLDGRGGFAARGGMSVAASFATIIGDCSVDTMSAEDSIVTGAVRPIGSERCSFQRCLLGLPPVDAVTVSTWTSATSAIGLATGSFGRPGYAILDVAAADRRGERLPGWLVDAGAVADRHTAQRLQLVADAIVALLPAGTVATIGHT